MPTASPLGAGTVAAYAGDVSAPDARTALLDSGWLPCDGTSYAASAYPDLFAAIGTANGGGSGSFNVPDLRSRLPRGVNGSANMVDPDATSRTAANPGGNTGNAVGSFQDTGTGLPASPFAVATAGAHSHNFQITGDYKEAWGGNTQTMARWSSGTTTTSSAGAHQHAVGGGDPFTMPVNIALNYIIKATAA
jgi:microcystin-dependent protein